MSRHHAFAFPGARATHMRPETNNEHTIQPSGADIDALHRRRRRQTGNEVVGPHRKREMRNRKQKQRGAYRCARTRTRTHTHPSLTSARPQVYRLTGPPFPFSHLPMAPIAIAIATQGLFYIPALMHRHHHQSPKNGPTNGIQQRTFGTPTALEEPHHSGSAKGRHMA